MMASDSDDCVDLQLLHSGRIQTDYFEAYFITLLSQLDNISNNVLVISQTNIPTG